LSIADIQPWFTALGSVVAFVLFAIKIWEVFFKDRVRLESSYSFTGEVSGTDEVTIVNLSPRPVQVRTYRLIWKRRFWKPWMRDIDTTPDEPGSFKVSGYDSKTLVFSEGDRIKWDHTVASGRQLVMFAEVYGRRREKRIVIGGGQ
jgi:hypothetical protein